MLIYCQALVLLKDGTSDLWHVYYPLYKHNNAWPISDKPVLIHVLCVCRHQTQSL